MIEWLGHADAALMVWLNGFHNSFFDGFMYLTSEKWVWVPVYTAIFVAVVMKYGFSRRMAAVVALFAITITLADSTCAAYLRPIFCRPRPCRPDSPIYELIHVVNGYRRGHYGMPSCHSANSFALAALVALVFRKRRLTAFIYIWAVIHTYSRIYLGVHYPGDIVVGGVVGTLYALGVYYTVMVFTGHKKELTTRPLPANIVLATGCAIFTLLVIVPATRLYPLLLQIL